MCVYVCVGGGKWPHGPSKTTDNTRILNRNQREALVFRLSLTTELQTCCLTATQTAKE